MFKILLTLIKIGIVVAAAIWLAEQPGSVTLNWQDYKITAHLGMVLAAGLGALLLLLFLHDVWQKFTHIPQDVQRYSERRKQEKGYKALTLGLTAVAAGDAKIANYQSYRANKFLGSDQGLPLLLEAQAARLKGDEAAANKNFAALLENPDTAFLGVRGLLQAALDHGKNDKALDYAHEALRLHPKQTWVLRTVYDLELRRENWDEAAKLLKRLEKAGGIDSDEATSDRAAMETAQGLADLRDSNRENAAYHFAQALKKDPSFLPAALELTQIYLEDRQRGKAQKLLEATLKRASHPDLIRAWANLVPKKAANDPLARLQWIERLVKFNVDDPALHMAAAQAAIDMALWGEARTHLENAEKIAPSGALYRLYMDLEKHTTKDEEQIALWEEKAISAPADAGWYCAHSSLKTDGWHVFSPYDGAFNTIRWGRPVTSGVNDNDALTHDAEEPPTVLEAPKI